MTQKETAIEPLPLRILTHNIRYATKSPSKNERPWAERYPLLLRQFKYHTRYLGGLSGCRGQGSSFICLQEALHSQLLDILTGLNDHPQHQHVHQTYEFPSGPVWAHIGVARDDGKEEGEYNPIIYPVQAFKLLEFETRWLSPTPERPSKGWDAGSRRILTIGAFEHRETGRRLIACNTHLDNEGAIARQKSIPIILETIEKMRKKWAKANDLKPQLFLAGDFNSFPNQQAYLDMARSEVLDDVTNHVSAEQRYGDDITFTGFDLAASGYRDEIGRIDFVWVGPKENVGSAGNQGCKADSVGWNVTGYAVLPNLFDDGIFCSDHRCVVGDLTLRGG